MKKYLLIRMMQTVAIILFAANVSAQNQNVVISVRNIPVRTTLTQIRQAANVHFVYEEKNINSQQTVTLNYPQGTSLSTLLNNLCKQIGRTKSMNPLFYSILLKSKPPLMTSISCCWKGETNSRYQWQPAFSIR